MCYLVAKWFDQTGCLALQTCAGMGLVEMKRRIDGKFGHDRLQLVTITRPSAYGEYEPYTFVSSEQELVDALSAQAAAH
ncbi:hypothetical protein DMP06_01375 [Slackia equolifaciens]|uniref:Uncharacterized protein n=1 Tax=Slackia equolifaciens TaxID=498718 RepID=A0A3N0B536_9ACTN|nr:DUF6718 family protein [Slackia equolifaciens]RNL42088.1 hypothetical protein DMP06_01375 [Slackia equolifaciens]